MQIIGLFCVLYGIVFVEATPFHPDSASDLFKLDGVQGKFEFNSSNLASSILNSNQTLEVVKPEENKHVIHESNTTSESIPSVAPHNHGHSHGHDHSKPVQEHHVAMGNVGPVEMGLRNVVSAAGIATEEILMEMAALSSETLNMINTKAEILTSHAMNDIFKPLSVAEAEIKKAQECGKQFVGSFNEILTQIDGSLKACAHNLTVISESYKNQSMQIVYSISKAAEEVQNLPDSCEISQNFAVGTFCTVNNLAEVNTRVVMSVKDMKFITADVKENISHAGSSIVACHTNLVGAVIEKLKHLFKEVTEKCNQQQNKS